MMRAAFAACIAVLWSAAAMAQPSSYCAIGSAAIAQGEDKIRDGLAKCSPGDIVSIHIRSGFFAVARVCDFNKQIVTLGDQTVCVMQGGVRPVKSSNAASPSSPSSPSAPAAG